MPDGEEFIERITGGRNTRPAPMPDGEEFMDREDTYPVMRTRPVPMPDYSNAQIPGVDFMNFITGSGVRDRGQMMPMPRNIDPGTDAILRAIMARMQGGQ
jgi:hypothetical protein